MPAPLPFGVRLWNFVRDGAVALASSFGLHVVLLLLFAVLVVTIPQFSRDASLEFGWIPTSRVEQVRATRKFVEVEGIQPGESEPDSQDQNDESDDPPDDAGGGNEGAQAKPVDTSRMLDGRKDERLYELLVQAGGNEETKRTINLGLNWLKRQQRPSGNWSLHGGYPDAGRRTLRTDTGATALALLAFQGAGHTHHEGPHAGAILRGLKWLVGQQKRRGELNGDFHDHLELGRQTAFYAHSMATIAVCEAYALTGDEFLREPAQRAVRFLERSQHPTKGGWRYQPLSRPTDDGDLSVTGWAIMALFTARAAGLDVDAESFYRSMAFLDAVEAQGGSRYRYQDRPGEAPRLSMTATGLLCRQYLGWGRENFSMQAGVRYLLQDENLPRWEAGKRDVYAWYYQGQVLHNMAGDDWKEWYAHVQQLVVDNQVRRGSRTPPNDVAGSWSPVDPPGSPYEHADQGGRLYMTAMSLLLLEMPFRHMPVYAE